MGSDNSPERRNIVMASSSAPSAPAPPTASGPGDPGTGDRRQGSGRRPPPDLLVVVLFSATLLVSAALVFLIQPMIARFLLPLAGGTPAVWNVTLMFFQLSLLGAYLYAHVAIRRLGVRRQALVHLIVMAIPLVLLPIGVPAGSGPPQGGEIFWLLGVLATTVGLPFFVVASTAPMVQRWLAAMDHPRAADPYFLYRASNVGSIIGLVGYPLAAEPQLRLGEQGALWGIGYGLLFALVLACAATLFLSASTIADHAVADPMEAEPDPAERPTLLTGLRWAALGFVPSSLMLGVTGFLTTDLAPIPLLWVIPLSLYLLSFIIVFSPATRAPIVYRVSLYLLPPLALVLAIALIYELRTPFRLILVLHLVFFFVAALVCHGRLASERPHPRFLTGFYLWLALGGALGGTFNALIAPLVFDGRTEYPLAVVLACLCLPAGAMAGSLERGREFLASMLLGRKIEPAGSSPPAAPTRERTAALELRLDVILPLVIGAVLLAALYMLGAENAGDPSTRRNVVYGLMAIGCLAMVGRPLRFGLSVGAVFVAAAIAMSTSTLVIESDRSFFSDLKVESYGDGRYKRLLNGTTLHGAQLRLPGQPLVPITYYHPTSPVGEVVNVLRRRGLTRNSAVVGLGTGSMACHSRRGERWTFYEIDPLVERIARNPRLFTFLSECRGSFDVVLGDARISLAREPRSRYGLITLDAFSSDAIPTHLLTQQAIELYRARLAPGGVLAFHISNRYLELEPVLGDLGRATRMACFSRIDTATDRRGQPQPGKTLSHWVMLARSRSDLGRLPRERARWRPCATGASAEPWSDDYSNILNVVSW